MRESESNGPAEQLRRHRRRGIDGFISSESFDNLLIVGDFNVDFDCACFNSSHLLGFMDDYNISAGREASGNATQES